MRSVAMAIVLAGCATTNSASSFQQTQGAKRAAFDLGCSQDQLQTTLVSGRQNIAGQPIDGMTVGVTGCGKKATYIWVDTKGWILNSPVQSAP
jgi:hypothetical protein